MLKVAPYELVKGEVYQAVYETKRYYFVFGGILNSSCNNILTDTRIMRNNCVPIKSDSYFLAVDEQTSKWVKECMRMKKIIPKDSIIISQDFYPIY